MTVRDRVVIVRARVSLWTTLGTLAAGATGMVIAVFDLLPVPFGFSGRVVLGAAGAIFVLFGIGFIGRAVSGWESIVGGPGWLERVAPWRLQRLLPRSRLEGDLADARLRIDDDVATPASGAKKSGVHRVTLTTGVGALSAYGSEINDDVEDRFREWLALQSGGA